MKGDRVASARARLEQAPAEDFMDCFTGELRLPSLSSFDRARLALVSAQIAAARRLEPEAIELATQARLYFDDHAVPEVVGWIDEFLRNLPGVVAGERGDEQTRRALLLWQQSGDRNEPARLFVDAIGALAGLVTPEAARSLARYATFLTESGQPTKALAIWQQLESMTAELARHDPQYGDDHAQAVTNLATGLAETGNLFFGLDISHEALTLWQQLAQTNPVHQPDYAAALNNHSKRLAETGHLTEALDISHQALNLWQQLATTNPAHQPDHARALTNHSVRLAQNGHHSEALDVSHHALSLWQQLTISNPAHQPDHARAFTNHNNRLAQTGRLTEALEVSHQALTLWQQLATTNPAHQPDHARALTNHNVRLAEIGRRSEALDVSRQALTLWQQLAYTNPAHSADYASAFSNLSIRLAESGATTEAIVAARSAVEMWGRLADVNPAHIPRKATALLNLVGRLSDGGKLHEALDTANEAMRTWQLLDSDPTYNKRATSAEELVARLTLQLEEQSANAERFLSAGSISPAGPLPTINPLQLAESFTTDLVGSSLLGLDVDVAPEVSRFTLAVHAEDGSFVCTWLLDGMSFIETVSTDHDGAQFAFKPTELVEKLLTICATGEAENMLWHAGVFGDGRRIVEVVDVHYVSASQSARAYQTGDLWVPGDVQFLLSSELTAALFGGVPLEMERVSSARSVRRLHVESSEALALLLQEDELSDLLRAEEFFLSGVVASDAECRHLIATGFGVVVAPLWTSEADPVIAAVHRINQLIHGVESEHSSLSAAQRVMIRSSKDELIAWIQQSGVFDAFGGLYAELCALIYSLDEEPSSPTYWAGYRQFGSHSSIVP